jgi:hypothetical protein
VVGLDRVPCRGSARRAVSSRVLDHPFRQTGVPWWNAPGVKAESVVQLNSTCLGLRVKLSSGERITMPLGPTSFVMRKL